MEIFRYEMVYGLNVHNTSNRKTKPMKTKQVFFCAFVFGTALCFGQGNVVYYGVNSNALDVAFEDANLSVSNQTFIVADLNLCLQSSWGKRAVFRMGHDDPAFDAHLHFGIRSPYFNPFPRDIVVTPSGHALHISQELSDFYTNQFVFVAAYSNMVVAAYEFVVFLNSPDFANLPTSELSNYYFAEPTRDLANGNDQKLITALASYDYDPPTILKFRPIRFKTEPGVDYLITSIPYSFLLYGLRDWNNNPAIWHDGRWKLMDIKWFYDPSIPSYEKDEEE